MSERVTRCVMHTHAHKLGTTWCGKEWAGWAFVDIDHAAYTRLAGDYLTVCPQCRTAIIKALRLRFKQ